MLRSLKLLILSLTIAFTSQLVADPANCTSSQYYDYLNFGCTVCPVNMVPASIGFCNCSAGYYHDEYFTGFQSTNSTSATCKPIGTGADVFLVRDVTGAPNGTSISCAGSAYPNSDKTQCVACPLNMSYNSTLGECYCSVGYVNINNKCINSTAVSNITLQTAIRTANLKWVNLGCLTQQDPQSCQLLLNMCAADDYSGSSEFCLLIQNNLVNSSFFPTYLFNMFTEINLNQVGFSVSTQSFTNNSKTINQLDLYVAEFDENGAYLDFRPLRKELFLCNTSVGDSVSFQSFASSFYLACDFSADISYSNFYDLYIKTSNGTYAEVPVQLITGTSTYYVKRFTTKTDLGIRNTTLPTSPNVVYSSVTLMMQSGPPLLTPYVVLSKYSPGQSPKAVIKNNSKTQSAGFALLIPFIVMGAVILAFFVYKMYLHVKYNPQELGENTYCFRMLWASLWIACRCWTVGMFVYLAGVSVYCFCFYKLQNALYVILPDPSSTVDKAAYYTPFYTLFFITVGLGLVSVLELIWGIANVEYLLMDWETPKVIPGKFQTQMSVREVKPSIWRKLFVVNELYELSLKRASNLQFTLILTGLFLQGLSWSNLKYMIPNTSVETSTSQANPLLSYFINTFLMVVISAVQILVRKLLRVWWPLPAEQFIDLCCISNFSVLIFDQSIHGYYIHGMSPLGKAQGSLQYIDSIFDKQSESYGRNRGLLEQDEEHYQSFEVVAPRIMRFQLNKLYLQKIQQVLSGGVMTRAVISKPVPQMNIQHYENIQRLREDMMNNFRLYLQQVKHYRSQQIVDRNWLTRMFSCPPSSQLHSTLPVFFKDPDYMFTNAFLGGNQWLLLINQINIFNLWYLITGRTFVAVFLTFIFKWLITLFAQFKMKRNISLNTLVDDKFFV